MTVKSANHRLLDILIGIACLLAAAAFTALANPASLGTDAAQYANGAGHLLQGHGFATDLLYYEIHYRFAAIPAPQTVFPPGFSFLIAIGLWTGLSATLSIIVLNAVSLGMSAFLLYRILRLSGANQLISIVAVAMQLGIVANWTNAQYGNCESVFVAATLLALYSIARWCAGPKDRRLGLIMAGLFGLAAFTIRYQGAFFLLALGTLFAARWLIRRDASAFLDVLAITAAPLVLSLLIVYRNFNLTGGFSGGPMQDVQLGESLAGVAQKFYWEASKLLGFSGEGLRSIAIAESILVITILCLIAGTIWLHRRRAVRWTGSRHGLQIVDAAAMIYLIMLLAALTLLGWTKSGDYIQARYLATGAPYAIYLCARVASQLEIRIDVRWVAQSVALIAVTALALGQRSVYLDRTTMLAADADRSVAIRQALFLERPIGGGQSVGELLADPADAVFAYESQRTGFILDRGALGATPSVFAAKDFDLPRVSCIAAQYDIRWILHFPKLFDYEREPNRSRTVFHQLTVDSTPAWLEPVIVSDDLLLFERVSDPPCRQRPASRP